MDRVIEKKKWNTKRILTVAGIVAIVGLIATSVYFTSGKSKLNVDTERITIGVIKTAAFHEFITLNGVVLPESTIYLDAMEGGRVEEKFVEDGTMMTKGQPILRLSNTDLELQLANQETQVFNVLTQMQISKNNAEQNSINRQNQDAEVDNALKEAERVYNLNKKLYEQKVIGLQEFQSSKNLYDYQLRRKKLTEQIMKTDVTSMKQQVDQMGESYQQMKRTLALMRKKVGDLIVRAPVDGQLTSLDAEIGENKNKGQRLGQIDVMSGYKVRIDIDEHYINRIFVGLMGNCDVAGKTYDISAVSMGNPHGVLVVDNVKTAPVAELGPLIESHARFPARVNAGFMQIVSRNEINLRVFERGVGETLACGTGACGAVVAGRLRGLLDQNVKVNLPGGSLQIEWPGDGQPVIMTGPAVTVFHGQIKI